MLCNTIILLDTTLLKVDIFMKKWFLAKDMKTRLTIIAPTKLI